MSNDIQPNKLTANIASNKSEKNTRVKETDPSVATSVTDQSSTKDKVSVTDQASRLQEIESLLSAMPTVNSDLVEEISQKLASGNLEINLERTASNLIEMVTGAQDPSK